ncbi:hypothetical protein QAD02_011748 [Eretmocerus hayati]|uniref:Uncharacterized protein n=1 Tax=Eretmocerus hayati TaxID=131215 RepID=A0ACC2NXW3_9HYME|nr:hypothetical protein QAD02_011748 [Eretmocerus hayati]
MLKIVLFLSIIFGITTWTGEALNCYRCNSNQPGCGTPFNRLLYDFWGEVCPEGDDDICVKIIEEKGAERVITRECLSHVRGFRTDIPADKYEGCRPAAKDVRLGHYVNNSIHELDIHRDYYDSVTWCFCYFHHRCNSASSLAISSIVIFGVSLSKLL